MRHEQQQIVPPFAPAAGISVSQLNKIDRTIFHDAGGTGENLPLVHINLHEGAGTYHRIKGKVLESYVTIECVLGASSLAEYEARSRLPAHIHKTISLCILYSLGFWELLRTAGFNLDDTGHEPIPDTLVSRNSDKPKEDSIPSDGHHGLLWWLRREFEELPIFLRHSLPVFTGLPGLSLRDLFWTGGTSSSPHPLLKDTVLISVNRRLKKPLVARQKSRWEQPLYLLLMRDGTYQLASYIVEGRFLLVDSFSSEYPHYERLHPGVDAEVVGRVTAMLRRLR